MSSRFPSPEARPYARGWRWLLLGWSLVAIGFASAQSGPAIPLPAGSESQQVLAAALVHLEALRPLALYQPREDAQRGRARYAVQVLLGDEGGPFARLALHPRGLQPLAIGLESRVPPLAPRLDPIGVASLVQREVLPRLLLATLVLEEPEGYRVLLMHGGRIVGELQLDHALQPRPYRDWERPWQGSRWRYP